MGCKYAKNAFAARVRPQTLFCVFKAHGTCLVAANVVLPRRGKLTALHKSRSWIRGATSCRAKERGEGKKGRKRKGREGLK